MQSATFLTVNQKSREGRGHQMLLIISAAADHLRCRLLMLTQRAHVMSATKNILYNVSSIQSTVLVHVQVGASEGGANRQTRSSFTHRLQDEELRTSHSTFVKTETKTDAARLISRKTWKQHSFGRCVHHTYHFSHSPCTFWGSEAALMWFTLM